MSIIPLVRRGIPDSRRHAAVPVRGANCELAPGRDEEIANSITHGLGLVLSVAGLPPLLMLAGNIGTTRYALGCGIYGFSLVVLYGASTLFHSWPGGDVKRVFLLFDHVAIYVLIAGTYTPMALFAARGTFDCLGLTAAWAFALFGSCAKALRIGRLQEDSPVPYLVLSALCLVSLRRPFAMAPPDPTAWLLAGGLFYVGGLLFFFNDQRRFYHSIWHLFVVTGSVCHYRAVLVYLFTAVL
jgi:hemolysin III